MFICWKSFSGLVFPCVPLSCDNAVILACDLQGIGIETSHLGSRYVVFQPVHVVIYKGFGLASRTSLQWESTVHQGLSLLLMMACWEVWNELVGLQLKVVYSAIYISICFGSICHWGVIWLQVRPSPFWLQVGKILVSCISWLISFVRARFLGILLFLFFNGSTYWVSADFNAVGSCQVPAAEVITRNPISFWKRVEHRGMVFYYISQKMDRVCRWCCHCMSTSNRSADGPCLFQVSTHHPLYAWMPASLIVMVFGSLSKVIFQHRRKIGIHPVLNMKEKLEYTLVGNFDHYISMPRGLW